MGPGSALAIARLSGTTRGFDFQTTRRQIRFSNNGEACLRILANGNPPELCKERCPSIIEGAGNAG
jgi:hypothetical protein